MVEGPELLILGSGGHGQVLLDLARQLHPDWPMAFLDPDTWLHGKDVLACPVLGSDDLMSELLKQNKDLKFTVGLGAISPSPHRQRIFDLARSLGLQACTLIHPGAIISPLAELEAGVQIMAGAIVNTSARVGANALINSRALVEHDCLIEAHAHVASGAVLAGGVQLGRGAMIGAGATVRQYIKIGAGALVGAGAVVIKDVAAGATVVGVPAQELIKK